MDTDFAIFLLILPMTLIAIFLAGVIVWRTLTED